MIRFRVPSPSDPLQGSRDESALPCNRDSPYVGCEDRRARPFLAARRSILLCRNFASRASEAGEIDTTARAPRSPKSANSDGACWLPLSAAESKPNRPRTRRSRNMIPRLSLQGRRRSHHVRKGSPRRSPSSLDTRSGAFRREVNRRRFYRRQLHESFSHIGTRRIPALRPPSSHRAPSPRRAARSRPLRSEILA